MSKNRLDLSSDPDVGRALADTAAAMIWIANTDKECIYFNRAWLSFRGRTTEEEYGLGWAEGVHPEDYDRCIEIFTKAFDAREAFSLDYRLRRSDSQYRWIQDNGSPYHDNTGEFAGYIGTCFDIHEMVESRTSVAASQKMFQLLVETIDDVFWISKPGVSRIEYVSPGFERLWGIPPAALYASPKLYMDSIVPDDRDGYLACVTDHHDQGRPYEYTYRISTKEGGVRWIHERGYSVPHEADGQARMAGVCTDITEQKELQEQIHQIEKIDAIGQLAGGVAHDFNNQLAGILGYADLLASSLEDTEHKSFAQNICASAHRAADLTSQLLAFSRKGHIESKPVCLHQIVEETADLLQRSIDKRIVIHKHLDAELSTIYGDPSKIQNAILNLALNARDAMPEGGTLTFATEIIHMDDPSTLKNLGQMDAGDYITASVSDSGSGISDRDLARVFEPFFTTKEEGKGTGMGLASVQGTVAQHRGGITVESKPGRGSCFKLYLPLTPFDLESVAATTPPPGRRPAPESLHILLVDDDCTLSKFLYEQLLQRGHSVSVAGNGQEAIETFEREWTTIDVVLMDIIMPRVDGLTALQAMKKIDPDARVVLCSGYSSKEQAQQLKQVGVRGFVQKPFVIDQILEAVQQAVATD